MATIAKIAQGADKVDDLVKVLLGKAAGKKVKINRIGDGVISFTTPTGTASASSKLAFDMQMANLRLNNGDTFTRTITDGKVHDGLTMHGTTLVDAKDGHRVENLWNAFLEAIFKN